MLSPSAPDDSHPTVGVVIPCFRVKSTILDVLAAIPALVDRIYVVDDACPEGTAEYVKTHCRDVRLQVIHHPENRGVGGAMVTGYRQALKDGCDIIAKLDGDGQMDAKLLPYFITPIARSHADYTKGNRFYTIQSLQGMPAGRKLGNALLSFTTKLSSGYWRVFDPTNGYTCVSAPVLKLLPLDKIDSGYFFESDMLFRLNTVGALVMDIPMQAVYGAETSGLSVLPNAGRFMRGHAANFLKRIFYNYFLRNFSVASLELVFGLLLFLFGLIGGLRWWEQSLATGRTATAGTVMLAALPVIIGFQLLMSFIGYDIASQPDRPITPHLSGRDW